MKASHRFLMMAALGALIAPPSGSVQAQTSSRSSSSSSSYSSSSSTGPGGTSFSSSSNAVALKDTPLVDALASVSRTLRVAIFVSDQAADVLAKTSHQVTLSERNLSPEQLFQRILDGSHLVAYPIGSNICVLAESDSIEEVKAAVEEAIKAKTEVVKGLIPLNVILTDKALRSPVTLVMIQTPAPFVIQMLEGMTQVPIAVPAEFRDQFFVSQPLVTVQAQNEPLEDVLKSVAKQLGCELEVSKGSIAIRRPEPTTTR
jgi:hypothetical protein